MEPHSQIIELFGVPACGKSSVSEYIISNSLLKNCGSKVDMYNDFKKAGFLKKFLSFSISSFIAGMRFLSIFTKNENRKVLHKSIFLNAAWCRNYQRKYGRYSSIISDHGIIQDFVTWERGENFENNPTFKKRILKYLQNERDVIFVFCDIDPNIAFDRLSNRGRSKGRLDEMLRNDSVQLMYELEQEKNRFMDLYKILKSNNFKLAIIDTSYTVEQNVNNLIDAINRYKYEHI